MKSYDALGEAEKILDVGEASILQTADAIYNEHTKDGYGKGFEYILPSDAATGYSRFPPLAALDDVANKLIEDGEVRYRAYAAR